MNKKSIVLTILAFFISLVLIFLGSKPTTAYTKYLGINMKSPSELYRIYIAGKSIGVIRSKEELENYIDTKQQEIKDKYKVDKVYAPNDLKIIKEITYNEKISSGDEIYNKIEEIRGTSSFTIDGYKIEIKGLEKKREEEKITTEDLTLYVIDRDVWDKSVNKTITAFIDENRYNDYLNDTQEKIGENETGSIINNMYIKNDITITKGRIPAEGNIFVTEEELSQFLLFGTNDSQKTYEVKRGDTIEDIANNNQLSSQEFLIANPSFKSENDLLFPGQKVNLALINPQFDLVEFETVVSKETIEKTTIYKNDDTKYVGYEQVEEEGSNGLALVTQYREIINGEVNETQQISSLDLIPAVNKVVVRGTKKYSSSGGVELEVPVGIGSWVWPTKTPYTISSGFAWRWGKHHNAIDITGPGYGSPIKAANNGIVVTSDYTSYNGNYIIIKHSDNYYTIYGHLAARYKRVGDVVMANDVIGTMGMTGNATGVHLHFGTWKGHPYKGGTAFNPLSLYRR